MMRKAAYLLSLVLVFTIPWENAITVFQLGTLTRALGILTAAVWLIFALVRRNIRRPHPFHLAIFLFILWNIASMFWTYDTGETQIRIRTYAQLGVLTLILWDLYSTPRALEAAMEAYVLGAYITVLTTILNFRVGQGISTYSEGRYAGAGLNAVDLAFILILGLPVAWHLATNPGKTVSNRIFKVLNYAYIPGALFAVTLTGSRTAIFAVMPFIIYVLWTIGRTKPSLRIIIFAVLIGSLVWTLPYIPSSTLERLGTAGSSIASGDLGGRGPLWYASIKIFVEHPVVGVGSGALNSRILLGAFAHNTFLSILAELGTIGFLLFAIIVVAAFHYAFGQPRWFSRMWITVLVTWVIGASSLTWEFRKPTWLFLLLVIISASLWESPESSLPLSPSTMSEASGSLPERSGDVMT